MKTLCSMMGFPEAMDHHKSSSLMAISLYFFTFEAAALLLVPLSGDHFEDKLRLIIVFLVPHILFPIFVCVRLKVLEALNPTNEGNAGYHVVTGSSSTANHDIDRMVEEALVTTQRNEESELKTVTMEALEALKKERAKYEEDRLAWDGEKAKHEEERRRWDDARANLEEERQGWEDEKADLKKKRQEWEKESERRRKDLEAELDTVRKCADLYRNVLHDYHSFNYDYQSV